MNPILSPSMEYREGSSIPDADKYFPASIRGRDLHGLWHELAEDWLKKPSQYFAERVDGGIELPLERMISFQDPFPGILVFRSNRHLKTMLKDALNLHSPPDLDGRDLFTEAVVRFWQKFVWRSCGRNDPDLKPARFKTCTPSDWPAREPEASCFSFVGRCPLEIRFWAGDVKK